MHRPSGRKQPDGLPLALFGLQAVVLDHLAPELLLLGDERGEPIRRRQGDLHVELILFAARSERRRPELAKRLRARRALVAEILSGIGLSDPAHGSAMLLALEDGFRLHRLIDPASTPADSFVRSIGELQKLRTGNG